MVCENRCCCVNELVTNRASASSEWRSYDHEFNLKPLRTTFFSTGVTASAG